jgi:hypothetical protein
VVFLGGLGQRRGRHAAGSGGGARGRSGALLGPSRLAEIDSTGWAQIGGTGEVGPVSTRSVLTHVLVSCHARFTTEVYHLTPVQNKNFMEYYTRNGTRSYKNYDNFLHFKPEVDELA